MQDEVWKDIPGYEGFYQVSNFGRVKSLFMFRYNINKKIVEKIKREKILKQHIHKSGYMITSLSKERIRKQFYTHRLVASVFIPNLLNKPYINHIDCNPQNNCVDNLEWCTQKENINYSWKLGRGKIPNNKGRVKKCRKV